MATVRNMNLTLKVHGNTHICAGDIIDFISYINKTAEFTKTLDGNYNILDTYSFSKSGF